jgi:hypothetical protein
MEPVGELQRNNYLRQDETTSYLFQRHHISIDLHQWSGLECKYNLLNMALHYSGNTDY